ncbi:MAG: pilus assembly protein PilP [Deltaproteobacteria bacterium]|nr:pilus assembly protein PilP [Deltaproteobacteria bacterium]
MTQISHRSLPVVLAAAFLFALVGGGCAKEEQPAPAPVVKKTIPKEEAKAAEAAHPVTAAEGKPSPVVMYNPAGKRDPFVAFLKVERKESRPVIGSLPPLQRYELGELRFVGVIWSPKVTRALVEDTEGKGYTVSVGTRIGRSEGVVIRITEKEIVVREEFRDYAGSKVKRDSSLKFETVGGK